MASRMQTLTKLVEELASALEQNREAQNSTTKLAEEVLHGELPPLETQQVDQSVYAVLQERADLEHILQQHQDVLDIVDNTGELISAIRAGVAVINEQASKSEVAIDAEYVESIDAARSEYYAAEADRRLLVTQLTHRLCVLEKLSGQLSGRVSAANLPVGVDSGTKTSE